MTVNDNGSADSCSLACPAGVLRGIAAVIITAGLLANSASAGVVKLSAAEEVWIKEHPVIRVTSDAQLAPLEYMKNGHLEGLSADYMKLISERTGLRFEFTQSSDWPAAQRAVESKSADMLVNAMQGRLMPELRNSVQLTRPYLISYSVVFTRPDSPSIWSMSDLKGKRVAARVSGEYARVLQSRFPDITVVPARSPVEAFEMVINRQADATIGTELTFLPYITRRHRSRLFISRPPLDMTMQAQFATRSDWPELHGILEKALTSVTTGEESLIREEWIESEDFGAPTLTVVFQYNWPWILAVCILVASLAIMTRWAVAARRRAIQGELVKARFLATMSHEIRTPINAVLGAIEVLVDRTPEGPDRELVLAAESAAEALTGLLDNVLDLSKLDEGKMQLEKIPVDAHQLARKIASAFKGELEARNVALVVDAGTAEAWVLADANRLRQIMMNLLGNACKFTPAGSITLAVEVFEEGGSTWLNALVSDTGCGIPDALQAGIFDPYTQADGAIARRFGGTGLGLAICKELVALMGGRIELHSCVGEGTTVTFRVPVDRTDKPRVNPDSRGEESLASLKVLVVDDHAPNRLVLSAQLSRLGITAELADSAHSAMSILSAKSLPDVVLMDCFMPEIDGYQACRMIRSSDIAGALTLPVIAISAATDAAHLKRCLDSGMTSVLRKPIRLTELRGTLASISGRVSVHNSDLDDKVDLGLQALLHVDLKLLLADDLVQLLAALNIEDEAKVLFYAHRLHGAAGLAGYIELSAFCAQLELNPASDLREIARRVEAFLKDLRS